ncbi:MAG: Modulator of FtsH protease HflC [Myxococcota bacterium]|nr:Modulator of FtsH protease HflC [Myxococcota bacterium]
MSLFRIFWLVIAVITIWIFYESLFVVSETRQVVVTQFGEPIKAIQDPGLYFKAPWQDARYFDRRLIRWDGETNEIPTQDKRFIWLDATARWRIIDPLKFMKSVGDERGAQSRLDDVIDSVVRQFITENRLIEIVRSDTSSAIINRIREERQRMDESATGMGGVQDEDLEFRITRGREKIMDDMLRRAQPIIANEYGIELRDVRIKRINYVEEVRKNVYARMISERNKMAERYRSEGQGERSRILGDMERELLTIQSEAERRAREVEGDGDAQAAKIYAEATNLDPDFFSFNRTLQTYARTMGETTRMVLTTNSEYYRYLMKRGSNETPGVVELSRRLREAQDALARIKTIQNSLTKPPAGTGGASPASASPTGAAAP